MIGQETRLERQSVHAVLRGAEPETRATSRRRPARRPMRRARARAWRPAGARIEREAGLDPRLLGLLPAPTCSHFGEESSLILALIWPFGFALHGVTQHLFWTIR